MSDEEKKTNTEEFKVKGNEVIDRLKQILKEGNARRVIVKNEQGESILEIPVTIGVVGALLAPYLAAIGAVIAVVSNCSIVVEKKE
jgi:hypothetical protein